MDPEDLSSVPGYEGHIEYLGDKKSEGTLRITDLRLSDSAEYRFRLITSGEKFAGSPVSLTVTGNLSHICYGDHITTTQPVMSHEACQIPRDRLVTIISLLQAQMLLMVVSSLSNCLVLSNILSL